LIFRSRDGSGAQLLFGGVVSAWPQKFHVFVAPNRALHEFALAFGKC